MGVNSYILGACKKGGGGNGGGGSETFYPAVSGDDGNYLSSNFFYSSANTLPVGNVNNYSSNGSFIRFPNVTIPQGATIVTALLTLIGEDNFGLTRTIDAIIKIRAADEDNAAAPTTATDAKNRTRTTAAVDMSSISPDVVDGTVWITDDLKSVIQEIVDRGGWVSGNAILIFIDNNGTPNAKGFNLSSIDYLSGAEKAELYIEWE
jgi:hypothetical protein